VVEKAVLKWSLIKLPGMLSKCYMSSIFIDNLLGVVDIVRPFFPLMLAVLATAIGVLAQSVNWVQYINPTDGWDDALGVCLFEDYLAVVGFVDGTRFGEGRYFVALLNRTTGEVIKTWEGEYGLFFNCLSIGNRLYVVGGDIYSVLYSKIYSDRNGKIYIFDKGLNVVEQVGILWLPMGISFDGNYLYLAGWIRKDADENGHDDWVWVIQKWTPDLDQVAYRDFYREWDKQYDYGSATFDIAVNPATGDLWTVGTWALIDRTSGSWNNYHSLLVIFDKQLDVKRVVEYPEGHENYLGLLLSICFDDGGNAYVVGSEGVAKFDKYGNLLAVNKKAKGSKIACVKGKVYVFGSELTGGFLYVFDENLNPVGKHVFAEAYSGFLFGRSAFDGKSLYVAGNDIALGEYRIVVYSISLAVRVMVQVVDGFGRVRDWPVEVVGVAAGRGAVGVEVLPGRYTVKATAFGREYTQTVEVKPSQNQTVTIQVPTAVLNIVVLDDDRRPIDRYVTAVEISGPISQSFSMSPRDLEVLAGQYTIRVRALNKESSAEIELQPGEVKTVEVVVPGTAGLDFGGSRIPLPTLALYAGAVLAVVIAGIFAAVKLRRRGVQTREAPPPMQVVSRPPVGEAGAVGDFCLEYAGGVIPLSSYTVVGRGDFSGLPERVLEMVEEKHFAVYYREGEWWVEDLGSRRGTYLNGVRVKKERLREGDVISPGAAVAVVFKRCDTTRRVVPMEDDTQLWK